MTQIASNQSNVFKWGVWLLLLSLLASAVAVVHYKTAQEELTQSIHKRERSLALANQLRQSSDDLTRMVRTYVATGDPRYKQYFQTLVSQRLIE